MAGKRRASFNPKAFLAKVGDGRRIDKYRKGQNIFSQGDPADAVFYIQSGKAKITVVSEQGKEAVVAILGRSEERRVGKECRARWGAEQEMKKRENTAGKCIEV